MEQKVSKKNAPSNEKAALIAEFADDMKGLDIDVMDVREKTSVTDYFVICTGTSDTHVRAICDRVAEKLREVGIRPIRQSNRNGDGGGWVLFDYGDVIFHVMLEEKRQFYDLESFWKNLPRDPNLFEAEDAPDSEESAS